jgi:putative addiction module killer protein
MEPRPRIVTTYIASNGKRPFREFLAEIDRLPVHGQILNRVDRLALGVFGDAKSVGDGVSELRFHQGPGYRIYFGIDGDKVVLLCGGRKDRQTNDIARARRFWSDYLEKKD